MDALLLYKQKRLQLVLRFAATLAVSLSYHYFNCGLLSEINVGNVLTLIFVDKQERTAEWCDKKSWVFHHGIPVSMTNCVFYSFAMLGMR